MKRILLILSAVLLLASCGKKNGGETELTLEQKLSTEWHSTSITVDGDVYIDFKADHTFELYQRIGEGAYRLYRGSWGLEGDLLTGRYNDGEMTDYVPTDEEILKGLAGIPKFPGNEF